MRYALKLAEDNRILSACDVLPNGFYDGMTFVDALPDGNIADYRYEDGKYVYDPLPEPDREPEEPEHTLEERVATIESDVASLTAAIEKGLSL